MKDNMKCKTRFFYAIQYGIYGKDSKDGQYYRFSDREERNNWVAQATSHLDANCFREAILARRVPRKIRRDGWRAVRKSVFGSTVQPVKENQ